MTPRARVAVLASGGGSNLQALLDHHDALGATRRADVVVVASNRADAQALDRARQRGVAAEVLGDPTDGAAMLARLDAHGADLVVLAGYLKLVPEAVTRRFAGRMLNVHPALLPAFGGPGMYGGRVHAAVLAAGARVSGATVHFVDAEYDRGPIVAQWPVPVLDADTPESLAARVLRVEHLLLPRAVEALADGRVALGSDRRVHGAFAVAPHALLAFALESDTPHVAQTMDAALGAPLTALGARHSGAGSREP